MFGFGKKKEKYNFKVREYNFDNVLAEKVMADTKATLAVIVENVDNVIAEVGSLDMLSNTIKANDNATPYLKQLDVLIYDLEMKEFDEQCNDNGKVVVVRTTENVEEQVYTWDIITEYAKPIAYAKSIRERVNKKLGNK